MPLRRFFNNLGGLILRFFRFFYPRRCYNSDYSLIKNMELVDMTRVRVLVINNDEHLDGILYRLEKEWTVEFILGASLLGQTVNIFINHPLTSNCPFKRHTYYKLQWASESAGTTCLKLTLAGSFHYYVTNQEGKVVASGYLLVDPVLTVGDDEPLPLNCIQIQTVLAKCLGPLSTWEKKLLVTRHSGYNAIHFTPIQQLGLSKSSYCLMNHSRLNFVFEENNRMTTYDDIKQFINKIRTEWKMLSVCDIVLNHTANESPFLYDHPECSYNCINSPHLRPAYILDSMLVELTVEVAAGDWEFKGIPKLIETGDHLNAIRHALHTDFLPRVRIHEMYTVNVNEKVADFLEYARRCVPQKESSIPGELSVIQDSNFRRLKSTVDMEFALAKYNTFRADSYDEETRLRRCAEDFKNKLEDLNKVVVSNIQTHLNAAVENVIANIKYHRIDKDGPRIGEVSLDSPLVPRYFTDYTTVEELTLEEREQIMYSNNGSYLMAHNGWVMNGDPLKNFADPDSHVYLRRELIAWGDSVKLRYGTKPTDCPFLWDYMLNYVVQTAEIFDGVRLDNCHSTPIPVAEYMLDAARRVRPDLYVIAELFTNSDQTDNIFVNHLGITSLIREAMSASYSQEQGRLVYRYGGEPVGAFIQSKARLLQPSIAHAVFMDVTHDNPCPVQKRSVFDLLPSAALVSMACCASGSSRGYDELVPHDIHVVNEERQYCSWENDAYSTQDLVSQKLGIIAGKKALNDLHYMLGKQKFSQVFVDQIDNDVVTVTRHSPSTHESVILVAFTAFKHPDSNNHDLRRHLRPLRVEGVVEEIILEAWLSHVDAKGGKSPFSRSSRYRKYVDYINGLTEYELHLRQHIKCGDSSIIKKVNSGDPLITQLDFVNFQPGSVIAIRVALNANARPAIKKLKTTVAEIMHLSEKSELQDIIYNMDFADLNVALYRCDEEEREETSNKFGVYYVPGYGPLVYAGLQGILSLLVDISPKNDLGHPLCDNLRNGNWMIDYTCQRLKENKGTKRLGMWLEEATKPFKVIPRYLVPCYFDILIANFASHIFIQCYTLMSNFVIYGNSFVKMLSLVSVQVGGVIKSSPLPNLSPNLDPPKPKMKEENGQKEQVSLTLSAGLPHFAVGYMRNWGRDTFIALRGLFLLTGRYEEARFMILGYAGTLRHGLIPNLLDTGYAARFNCRDALWWWLYSIKCYIEEAPKGINILNDKVLRLFPSDEATNFVPTEQQSLFEVMQEALLVHFQGLLFRERNAGPTIDEHMTSRGFSNQIGVEPDTGFVFGGNSFNCGTWMDKMGSSQKADNKGKPATPRDGSAVEIVGLSKCVLTFLAELSRRELFPQDVNRIGSGLIIWSYEQWAAKIQANFEKYFYVNETPVEGEGLKSPELIHRRGIYKDTYGANEAWADFQLRPNFVIAMVVAPELFDPNHAWTALKMAEKLLLGPLGMKTLDPEDWAYNGYYDNSNDSSDFNTAHGFNYHQGPEWVWPLGYFLRARLHFAKLVGGTNELRRVIESTYTIISKHYIELSSNHWKGLPELTNANGSPCKHSCATQAWSASSIMEVLYDLQRITEKLKNEEDRAGEN